MRITKRTYHRRGLRKEFAERINRLLGINVKNWQRLPVDDLRKICYAIEEHLQKLGDNEEKVGG